MALHDIEPRIGGELALIFDQFHHEGNRKVNVKKPKFCWVSSHTSRRTFITLNIQLGTPQHYVMKWSNHTDPRSFKKYQNALQGESDAAQALIASYTSKAAAGAGPKFPK